METTQELVGAKIGLIILSALFAIWINYQAWKRGYFYHPTNADRGDMRLIDVLGAFASFLFMQLVIIPILAFIWFFPEVKDNATSEFELNPNVQDWLSYTAIVLMGLGLLCYTFYLNSRTAEPAWGSGSYEGNNAKHYLMGVLTWLISFPVVVLAGQLIGLIVSTFVPEYLPEQSAVKQLKESATDPYLFWTMVVIIITIVPVIEELLFRGYLQTWIKGHLGYKWAIFITAIIFALFHYTTTQGIGNIELLSSLFILALFLGWIYEKERSLWASIGLHSTFNALSIFMIILGI